MKTPNTIARSRTKKKSGSMLPSSDPSPCLPMAGRAITFHRPPRHRARSGADIFDARTHAHQREPRARPKPSRPRFPGAGRGGCRSRTRTAAEPSRVCLPAERLAPVPCALAPSAHHWPQLSPPASRAPPPPSPVLTAQQPAGPPLYLQQTTRRAAPWPRELDATSTSTLPNSRADHGAKPQGSAERASLPAQSPTPFLSSHGDPPRVPPPGRRARRAPLRRRGGGEGAQGRVLRGDVSGGRERRSGGHGAGARPRAPQRRLRHAPPVPRLLRQRVRRVGADGRHADGARREGRAVQHQLAALVRGRRRDQGGPGGALPRRRLLRRHRRHGRPRRRRPDRWAQLGGAARARRQPDGEPGGLGQHHAEPARQRQRAHPPLRGAQPQRHRPRRALWLALHRRGPLLLHRLPPLQPVRLRPPRPPHGRRLPPRARRALPQRRRRGGHGRHGRHPARLRQPLLQGPRRPPRLPQLRPDALLRQRQDPPRRQALQRGPGRLLQGLRRGDGQDGRAAEPQEGGDTPQLPRRQRLAGDAQGGGAVPRHGLLIELPWPGSVFHKRSSGGTNMLTRFLVVSSCVA